MCMPYEEAKKYQRRQQELERKRKQETENEAQRKADEKALYNQLNKVPTFQPTR